MNSDNICSQDKIVFDEERGEYICTETGEVLEDRIVDAGPEWRAYDTLEYQERARAKAINPNNFVNSGFILTLGLKPKKVKLSKLYPANQRYLYKGLKFLDLAAEQLNVSEVIKQEAGRIFQKLWSKEETHSLGSEIVVLVSIYLAYRKLKIFIDVDDYIEKIEKLFGIKRRQFTHGYFEVMMIFGEKIPKFTVEDYIKECGAKLELQVEVIQKALEIAKEIEKSGILSGRNPKVSAVGILYYVAKHLVKDLSFKIPQYEFTKNCNVTQSGIRKYRSIVQKYLEKK